MPRLVCVARDPPRTRWERQNLAGSRHRHLAAQALLPLGPVLGAGPSAACANTQGLLAPVLLPPHWDRDIQHRHALLDILCHCRAATH